MKKRIFSLLVLILVAVCGGVFAACTQSGGENVSIKAVSGLDSQISQEKIDSISNEILLSEDEKGLLSSGFGYNNSVKDGNTVSLVVGSETNGSRELIFEIENYVDGMSDKIFVSSDSTCVQISEIESAGKGRQKFTITASSAGTAEIVIKTGQYSKTTKIVVKAIEKLSSFGVKTNATIFLERGKELEISPEKFLNFFPSDSNLKEVEFYDGETLLTKDGKTILSTNPSESATGVISENKELTVKSLRLTGSGSVQTISVVIVDSLENLSMKKLVYSNNLKTFPEFENGKTITVIRNVSLGEINYGVRELYVLVDCAEEDLEIVATAKGTDLLVTYSDKERITSQNLLTSKFGNLIDSPQGEFSTWVFKFELKYEGISNYELEFGFKTGSYNYSNVLNANVEFKSASNLVNFAKAGESEDFSNTYTIYDNYIGTFGTRFVVSTNTSDEFSKAEISLLISGENALGFKVYDVVGEEKVGVAALGVTKISLKSGENFFIKANEGQVGTFKLTARVAYVFEGVEFVTEKEITLKAVNSPSNFFFNKENGEEISDYVFDLNTSGKIISGIKQTETYAERNSLTLQINGYVGSGALTGAISDFSIVSASPILQVTKDGSRITLLATGTGTGSFKILTGNGISRTFNFTIIQSISDAKVFVPTPEQNTNVISILSNYNFDSTIYDQYAIVKKNTLIPLVVSATGEVVTVTAEGDGISYSNGRITCETEFNKNELVVSLTYKYVEDDVIVTQAVVVQKILISSIVEIENFNISTSYGSSIFSLYDYSTVGYYSRNLAMATLQINILPNEIREEIFKTIKFSSNIDAKSEIDTEDQYTLVTDVFTFTFYRTGASAGTGTLICEVKDSSLLNENGGLKAGKVTLLASIDRSFDMSEGGNFVKFIQFDVKSAKKVEVISSQTKSIELDSFITERKIEVSTYPLGATNSMLSYVFIPKTSGLKEGDVEIVKLSDGIHVRLTDKNVSGEGAIRIIAFDSFTSASDYTNYLDIPVVISNGSQQFPYYINFESDVRKMVETGFEKYYIISGEIDLKDVQWESSKYVLSGGITGINNAKLKNINVTNILWEDSSKQYFGGLFTEIGGEAFIRNLAFEFESVNFEISSANDLDRAPSYNGFLGTIAGKNNGTLENVSVVGNINVLISGGYTLSVGGLFGENLRSILTSVTSSSRNTTLFTGKITVVDASISAGVSHTLYVGGVAGRNSGGRIERIVESGLVEFNNAFATTNVSIVSKYELESFVPDTENVEGFGAIAGFNRYQSSAIVEEQQGIFNVSVIGEIFAEKFNNVGGIVGRNDCQVVGARSQVYVRGMNNVGGGAGYNNGTLTSIIVESTYKTSRNNEAQAALVVGANNVGGIVGLMDGGKLESSSFISYISTTQPLVDLISSGNYGRVVAAQVRDEEGNLKGIVNFVVAIANVKIQSMATVVETELESANYAIFNRGNASEKAELFKGAGSKLEDENVVGKTKTELKGTEGFEFIFIPTDEIGLKLTESTEKFEMGTTSGGNVAFYLYYYGNLNSEVASKNTLNLSALLTSEIGSRFQVSSSDPSIIEVSTLGQLVVKKTGYVVLTATSEYVDEGKDQQIYIKVINYTNNLSIYLDSNKANEIKNDENGKIVFDATESKLIYVSFLDKFNIYNLTNPSDIKIFLKVKNLETGNEEIVKPDDDRKDGIVFRVIKISSDSYQIAVYGEIGNYGIEVVPYVEFVGNDGKTYVSSTIAHELINELDAEFGLNETVKTNFEFKNTTKSINVSKDIIITEPYYEKSIDVIVNSINENETITISAIQVDKNGNEINKNLLALDLKVVYGGVETTGFPQIQLEMNCKTNNKFGISVKVNEEKMIFEGTQYFIIKIVSSNGKEANMKLEIQPQSLISISTTLYPIISQDELKYNFKGNFSYIPSGVIIPGQNSLIELSLTPEFTYFKTIEIVNKSSNEYNLVFDLFNRSSGVVSGAKSIENGISIDRELINGGSFALRTFADQRLSDNSNVSIYIILKDENGNQIGDIVEKTFYVEHLPGVMVSIDGVSSGNEGSLLLAQGVSYDMNVWVKGYNSGAYSNAGSVITDGQIVLEVQGSELVSITRDSNGNYKLKVSTNELGTDRTVKIKSYGVNSKGERSKEVVLTIEIVEFVVKTDNVGDILKETVNNVYASATGNTYMLEVALNSDILIFDNTNSRIKESVLKFLDNLSTQNDETKSTVWQIKDNGKQAPNFVSIGGDSFAGAGSKKTYKTTNNAFEVTYNSQTGKAYVKFLKTESSAAPTFQVRYEGKFYYDQNGKPTAGVESGKNIYTLTQIISFDISEKTSLTNPYPIYTYEQFMDMRENNHYILMEDIYLDENFSPISTKIAMLDGNGHRIFVPSISLSSSETTSLSFGLFTKLSENALLKNITLYINGTVEINMYNFTSVNYGLLVAENEGKITNCSIEGSTYAIVNLNLFGTNPSSNINCEVGGLVAINNGDITNSRVEVGISINSVKSALVGYLPANLGGLVSINNGSGTISSCYVKARIENNTAGSVSAITGGLVSQNNVGGKIFACYTSGESTFPSSIEEVRNATEIVYSTASASGFVYTNSGAISNCYSNIPVRTNEGASGFVYQNQSGGEIFNCYSTSAFESSAKNGAFVGVLTGVVEEENPILNSGTITECFAWEEVAEIGVSKVNSGLASNKGAVVSLTANQFKPSSEESGNGYFGKFAFSSTANKTDGVWFWAANGTEAEFLRNGIQMNFSNKAPQLVSPNLIANAVRTLTSTIYDPLTETTIYNYAWEAGQDEGTKYNPYIIANQEDLEYIVSKQSGFTNGNIIKDIYCRLVGDIIYETSTVSSGLYQFAFLGNLEGNSYTIGNYVLDSSAKMDNGGFFASIGTASNQGGSIKNLTFAPRYMSLTNCNAVGAVAGSLFGGTLVNITIDGTTYASELDGLTIIGKNAVGGVVGLAEGAFNLNNIKSNISVNATYRATLNGHSTSEYLKSDLTKISYSGLVAGIAGGYGNIVFVDVYGNNVSVAENASLMFGYVGKDVSATHLTATGSINQLIKADVSGGVVAAHNYGSLSDITVMGLDDPSYNGFFDSSNYVPESLGNIVGKMSNGSIKDATVYSKIKAQAGVDALGGAVGTLGAGKLENILIVGNIVGGSRIGGVVGQIRDAQTIELANCAHSGTITSNSSSEIVTVGTLVGFINKFNADTLGEGRKIKVSFDNSKFWTDYNSKLESGIYSRKLNITTYSTLNTEVWYGTIVCEDGNFERGVVDYDQYNLVDDNVSWYVPLATSKLINGKNPNV